MTRAPCTRRTDEALPRAEKFGDSITAVHSLLNEECESRNKDRYAVVVQDFATQWIQSYPCEIKNFTGNRKKLAEVPRAIRKTQRSFSLTILGNLQHPVKIHHGIIGRQHLVDLRRMALLHEQYEE